jgi:hypothetical protein
MRKELWGVLYFYALEQNPAATVSTFTRSGATAK